MDLDRGGGGSLTAAGATGASGSITTESTGWSYETRALVHSSCTIPTSVIDMGGVYTVTIPGSSSTSDSDYRKTDAGWSEAEATAWAVYDPENEASGTITEEASSSSWALTWLRSSTSVSVYGVSSTSSVLSYGGETHHERHASTASSESGSSSSCTSTDTSTQDTGGGPTTTTTTSTQTSTTGTPPTPPENPIPGEPSGEQGEGGTIWPPEWWLRKVGSEPE